MTAPEDDRGSRPSPVDDTYIENLDALTRDLDDIEALAAAALDGTPLDRAAATRISQAPSGLSYDVLTEHNRRRREDEEWGEAEVTDILDPAALHQLDEWRSAQRLPWERSDLAAVGVAGFLGALANLYDTQLDATVLEGLAWLKKTDLITRWEHDAKGMPVDYMGSKFGGPGHRGLSPGHDVGRFFNALKQVRTGTFEGTYWEYGERFVRESTTTPFGTPYAQVDLPLAVAQLLKHWVADFVTPMSLPLPGWTLLRDMPDRELRTFAQEAYAGDYRGSGLNLCSGLLTPGLGMFATEVIIRTHTHIAAYRETGSPRLSSASAHKRTEMLFGAHAAAGAVSLSKTAASAIAGEAVVAARHLNVPVLMRVGMLALKVRSDAAARAGAAAPDWANLLEEEAATWTLPEAVALAELIADPGPGEGAE
ncbi:hypothetical protein GHK92_10520 [Nocardioides sp. dk4132]|uniref:hypothetical protein n=1 Tax=unclassified Nocardioides TaxID=2615069 RepID=UPI0012961A5C|nr:MULTISPECIES: hypothetical protein [unclassified Nocardioides]MQW76310.1 hypothetical protein [Nocardioides sp. dk4132]QGA07407.1 hypothetical protein GFH29_08400 [Nocardioides sp. dk884]